MDQASDAEINLLSFHPIESYELELVFLDEEATKNWINSDKYLLEEHLTVSLLCFLS